MPELPEVETVCRGLAPAMVGACFTRVEMRRPDLRFPFPKDFVARLEGKTVTGMYRRAKFLVVALDSHEVLIMHLGMSGRFIVEKDGDAISPGDFQQAINRHLRHDHVVFELSSGFRITYNDVRRFGFMALTSASDLLSHPHFDGLGVEPLGNAFNADLLDELFDGKQTPLKSALLDQRLIAGLGNIYVCETLHRAHLAPERAAGSLAGPGKRKAGIRALLVSTIRDVLNEAIEAGGSTLRDYAHTDGSLGYFQHRFRVYDQEDKPCPSEGCSGIVLRMVQAGRSTFYCAKCQR